MKIKNICRNLLKNFSLILFCQITLISGVKAELDIVFRDNFDEVLSGFCHHALDYSLDREYLDVQVDFHQTMTCVFDDAIEQMTNEANKIAIEKFSDDDLKQLKDLNFAVKSKEQCKNKTLKDIQEKQKKAGLQTFCEVEEYDTVNRNFSACRVAETAWSELCGYRNFLWGKSRDDNAKMNQKEVEGLIEDEDIRKNPSEAKQIIDEIYDVEMGRAEITVTDMIQLYQKLEQNYRIHSLFTVIYEELIKTKVKLYELLMGVKTWPYKFRNSSATFCW